MRRSFIRPSAGKRLYQFGAGYGVIVVTIAASVVLVVSWQLRSGAVDVTPDQLFQAADWHNTYRISDLLDRGASPNTLGDQQYTVLMYAAMRGNADIVRLLLQRGADPNLEGPNHLRPLSVAIAYGNEEVIDLLSQYGATTGDEEPAIVSETSKAARLLIRRDASPTADKLDLNQINGQTVSTQPVP